jgi:membrane protein DedA with SNARE-associated domain
LQNTNLRWLRKNASRIILLTIVVFAAAYLLIEILEDVLIGRTPVASDPVISAIISFTRDVTATVKSLGYSGIFFLMLLESSSLPIPSEVILPLAGYLISEGLLNLWVTIAVATIAGVAGSLIDYYIGRKGVYILQEHKLLGRIILTDKQLWIVSKWFSKYGSIVVLLGRLLPGFRTIVSFPAGAVKMNLLKFSALTAVGCLIWNTILIYVGIYLGANWTEVAGVLHYIVIGALLVVVFSIIGFFVLKRRNRKIKEIS